MRTTKQTYREFIDNSFPGYEVRKPLYFTWHLGIRFDLQELHRVTVSQNDDVYFKACLNRAVNIFESTFSKTDDVFIVITSFKHKKRKIRVSNFIYKQISGLENRDISYRKVRDICSRGDKSLIWNQAIIITNISKINYMEILSANINSDFARRNPHANEFVFFINIRTKSILHVYDDRGLDFISSDKGFAKSIFEKHKNWVLDIDFDKVRKQFE